LKILGTIKNAVIVEKINIEDRIIPLNLKKDFIFDSNCNQKTTFMANKKDFVSLGLELIFNTPYCLKKVPDG